MSTPPIWCPTDIFLEPASSAVIWLNGPMLGESAAWTRLWNGARRRYATDGATNVIMKRQTLRSPDIVNGDFDSIDAESLEEWGKCCTIIHTPDQLENDLFKAIRLVANDFPPSNDDAIKRIVLLGGLQGRFDHVMQTVNSLLKARQQFGLQVYAFDGVNVACVLDEGPTHLCTDRSLLTGVAGLIPICQRKTVVTTKGMKWDVENMEFAFGDLISTSNELVADKVEILSTAPLLVTVEVNESTFK